MRDDPSPSACAICAEMASDISNEMHANVGGAAEERAYERGEDRGGRDAQPPRRLQMVAKLVALSPLLRLSFASLRATCPTLASIGRGREARRMYVLFEGFVIPMCHAGHPPPRSWRTGATDHAISPPGRGGPEPTHAAGPFLPLFAIARKLCHQRDVRVPQQRCGRP
jgi:hypothetical protein